MNSEPTILPAKHIVPTIISVAMFMEGVDMTIINTAIPTMAHSLHVNPIDLKIALISYLLSLAIFIPISGWLADKFGGKKVFLSALIIFTVSSFWCGWAAGLKELVVARFFQGLGGALMVPVGRLIIVRTFDRNEIIATMSRVVMAAAIGPMLGPFLGGVIVHHFTWRWIFWVNVPVGIMAILLTAYKLIRIEGKSVEPLDKVGFILFGFGLATLTFGLSALSESNFKPFTSYMTLSTAIILLFSYVIYSRQSSHPIVNTKLFIFRTFRIAVLGNLISRLGIGGISFLMPLLLQIGLGYSAQLSGLLLVPVALGLIAVKPFIRPLLQRFHFKRFLIFNTIMLGIFIWLFILINHSFPVYGIAILTFIFGMASSLQFSAMNPLAFSETPAENLGDTTSIMSTIQQIALSFSVAFCAFLLKILSKQSGLTVSVFHLTFFVMGAFTIFASIIFMNLQPQDGSQLIE